MADCVNNVPWYTVWDAKTGDLLASGTAAMCARRLGYASANSFAASVCHWLKDGRQHVKYICQRELIPRSEVDSLPRKTKRPAHEKSRRAFYYFVSHGGWPQALGRILSAPLTMCQFQESSVGR